MGSSTRKQESPRCRNCGEPTVFPSNTEVDRLAKAWCSTCFDQWKQYSYAMWYGEEVWCDGPMPYRGAIPTDAK